MQLKDGVVAVTGAARGIGAAIALGFARAGATSRCWTCQPSPVRTSWRAARSWAASRRAATNAMSATRRRWCAPTSASPRTLAASMSR